MTYGTSIVLIAVGAILRWAVDITWHASTVNWHLVGDILIVLGVIGLVMSLAWMVTAGRRTLPPAADPRDYPPYS
jgi:hypothetical protein